MAANPMASRSAALAGAAQALNKPKTPGSRQDLSGASGGTIQGAHGGVQQLGEAAKRRLGGQQDPNQSPPIVAPSTAGGGLNPDAQKPGNVGFTKPMALPGFMSALPKPDPGMQIFDGGAKLPVEAPNMIGAPGGGGGVPPIPPELAQMLSERLGAGGMGSGAPDLRGVRDEMMGGGAPGMSAGDSPDLGGIRGKLPGFDDGPGGGPLGGKPMQTKPIFNPNGGMQAGGLPTKPQPMPTDQPDTGGVWGQIAGSGAGFRPNGRRNNMASY